MLPHMMLFKSDISSCDTKDDSPSSLYAPRISLAVLAALQRCAQGIMLPLDKPARAGLDLTLAAMGVCRKNGTALKCKEQEPLKSRAKNPLGIKERSGSQSLWVCLMLANSFHHPDPNCFFPIRAS